MGNIFIRFSMKKIIFCFMADMENRKKNVSRPGYIKISGAVLFFVLIDWEPHLKFICHIPPELVTVRKFNSPETLNNFFPDFGSRKPPRKDSGKMFLPNIPHPRFLFMTNGILILFMKSLILAGLGKSPWEKVKKDMKIQIDLKRYTVEG